MNLAQLADVVFGMAEKLGVPHMGVGAIAVGLYGIPRATKDVDLLVSMDVEGDLSRLMDALDEIAEFDGQTHFDTITWGRRHVGVSRGVPPLKIELFETFDDDFVRSEFSRRSLRFVPMLNRPIWLPTAEDVVVQKLRWARPKDLEDARDVLAVQDPATLDMDYVRKWCAEHGSEGRLDAVLDSIPPL